MAHHQKGEKATFAPVFNLRTPRLINLMKKLLFILVPSVILLISSCATDPNKEPSEGWTKNLQQKLAEAKPGSTIELPEGVIELQGTLSLDGIENVTIVGKGKEKTILSFKGQAEGEEGLLIKANGIILKDFSVLDTKGDAVKIQNAIGVNVSNVNVGWTIGPSAENGAYGINPIACDQVRLDGCEAYGASVAGFRVSQSQNVIIKACRAHDNVVGIAIENSYKVDIFECLTENNAGGICLMDQPDAAKAGSQVRVYNNDMINNNLSNFGAAGSAGSVIPTGTGCFIMAYEQVEIMDNDISGNNTVQLGVGSYQMTGSEAKDAIYNPYSSTISIYGNRFGTTSASADTTRNIGKLVKQYFGNEVPQVVYDGNPDPATFGADGKILGGSRICVRNNGDIKFGNLDLKEGFKNVSTDLAPHDCEHYAQSGVVLN